MVKTQVINDGGSSINTSPTKNTPAVKQVSPTKVTVTKAAPQVQVQQQQMPAVQVQKPQPTKTLTPATTTPVRKPKQIQQPIGPYNTNTMPAVQVGPGGLPQQPNVQTNPDKQSQLMGQRYVRDITADQQVGQNFLNGMKGLSNSIGQQYIRDYDADKQVGQNALQGALQGAKTYLNDPNAGTKSYRNQDDYSYAMMSQAGSQLIGKVTGLVNMARQGSKAYIQNQIQHSGMDTADKIRGERKLEKEMEASPVTGWYEGATGEQKRLAYNAEQVGKNLTATQNMVSQGFGSAVAMLPDMILSMGVGTALGWAGEGAALIEKLASDAALGQMFLSATGNGIQAAKDEGFDDKTANLYGLSIAAIEIATEKMSGGLNLYGESIIPAADDLIQAGIKRFKNENVQWLLHNAAGVLGEGFEEFVSEIADAYIEKYVLGKYEDMTYGELTKEKLADAYNSFVIGAISALFMNGASGQYSTAEKIKYLTECQKNFNDAPDAAKEAAVETVAKATGQTAEQVAANLEQSYQETAEHADNNTLSHDIADETLGKENPAHSEQDDLISSYISSDVTGKTPEEARRVQEYLAATDPILKKELIAMQEGKLHSTVAASINNETAARIESVIGINPAGVGVTLYDETLSHFRNQHSRENGRIGGQDSSLGNLNDVARVGYVINSPDTIYEAYYNGRFPNGKSVLLEKKIDGTYYVVEVVTQSKRGVKAFIASISLQKEGKTPTGSYRNIINNTKQNKNDLDSRPGVQAPSITSKNVDNQESSNEIIPTVNQEVNTGDPIADALTAQQAPERNDIADALLQQERTPISEYEGEQIIRSTLDDSEIAMPVKAFGKRLGRDIVVVEDLPLHANGVWMDGKIYIPESVIRSGKETWTVVRHELTHSLRGAKVFDKYINYAVDQMRTQMGDNWENYYNQKVQDYSRAYAGAENFDSLINEEIAAEYTQEYLFNNQEAVNQLVRSSRSTAQRIWQTLKDMARKLTGIDSPEAAAIRRAERMFAQAIAETNDSKAVSAPYRAADRFSLPSTQMDSEGKTLSRDQQNFFRDSKVRDEDGNLRVVYHGTDADFTVFDRTKSRANMDIQGNFFSPWEIDAGGYGENVKAYYLNITNPAPESIAYGALRRFQGQNGAGVKAREFLESLGYDGVNNGDEEYIAFYPEQIKEVSNLRPTQNPDVRFSLPSLNPSEITSEEVYDLLEGAKNGQFNSNTYIPVRSKTQEGLLEIIRGNGFDVEDAPLIMKVLKVQQAEEYGSIPGEEGHELSSEDIQDILEKCNDPLEVYYQSYNGRFGAIVPFDRGSHKAIAVLEFATPKNQDMMNGFPGGNYNTEVTVYAFNQELYKRYISNPDNIKLDKKRRARGSSGSTVPPLSKASSNNDFTKQSKEVNKKTDGDVLPHGMFSLRDLSSSDFDVTQPHTDLDNETVAWLDSQPTQKVYRAMQVIDGELYPPMAAKVASEDGGKRQLVQPSRIGEWERSKGRDLERKNANGPRFALAQDNPYSYDNLIKKDPLEVVRTKSIESFMNGSTVDRTKVVDQAMRNASALGTVAEENNEQVVYVKNKYLEKNIKVTKGGIRHSLRGSASQLYSNAEAASQIGEMVKNGLPINALIPTDDSKATMNYVLLCPSVSEGGKYPKIVSITIDLYSGEIVDFESTTLHSVSSRAIKNQRREPKNAPGIETLLSADTISVKDFLPIVNMTYQSLLSNDVLSHFGYAKNPDGYYTNSAMFSLPASSPASSIDSTSKKLKKTFNSKMSTEEISNRLNELFHSFDTMDFSEAEREELAGYIARDIADMIPTRKAISTESQHVLNTLKDITIRLTDSQKSEARHAFGDLREFQKAIAPVKMRNDGEMLTDAWLDWSQDSGSNGMIDTSIPEDSIPSALAELVGKLKDTHEELDYDVLEEITSDILEAYNNQEADVSDLKDPGEIDEFKDMYGDGEGIRSIDSTGIAQKINGNKRMNGFDSLFRTLDRAAGGDKEVRTWFDKMIERPMYEAHRRYNEGRVKAYDELQDIVDKYGIKAGTKESAAIQWYGEGYRVNEDGSRERYGLNKLKQEFPDSWEKIQEAEGWFRNKYDEYVDRINSVLEQIYPDVEEKQQQKIASIQYNIDQLKNQADDIEAHLNRGEYSSVYSNDTLQYVIDQIAREEKVLAEATKAYESGEYARNKRLVPRKDYFHHFQDVSEKGIGDLKNLFRGQEVLIDTNLVGISDTTKPKSRWMGFLQHQGKGEFTADAVGGMARYMPSAEYAIAFDPAIAHMRSVVTSLRDSTKKTRNANGLISYLSNFTNDLAGKTAGIDRAVTNFLGEVDGRATLDAIRKLNSRFKANAVGANVRSALAQFSNLPNGIAIVKSNSAWLKGIRDYADSIVKGGSDILDQSVFMTERYFDGDVSQFEKPTLGKKISDASNWMLEFGDKQAARLIWFSAYEEAMEKGLDDPVYYADRCTQQAVAGRGVGEVPYNMSSKMVNLFAPFQVEVNNTWQQLKKMTNERDARGMMRFMLSSWVFEGMMESLLGIDVIPDIFGTVVDTALKLIGGGDDDDDEEESVRAILTQGVREAIGQVVSAIPGASLIAQNIFGIDSDTGEKLFGEGSPSRYGVGLGGLAKLGQTAGDVVEAIANDDKSLGDVDLFGPLVETLMPFGGRQLTRSYKTAQDYGVVPSNTWGNFPFAGGERNTLPGSYTSKGALRFELPTDDPWEMAKAFLLGEYATDAGREYLENGRKTVLTQKQVEAMNEYAASGGDPHDYMQFIKGANTDGNSSISQAEAQEYLDGTNLDDDQKSLIWSLYGTNWKKNPYAETPSEETPSGEQAETSTTEDSTPKLTEAKQTKLDEYVAAGHDQQGMLDFYSGADADGNGRIKQEEAIEWFETSDLDDVQKALIWNLMWPKSAAKNPYD